MKLLKKDRWLFLLLAILSAIAIMLTSCATQRKAEKYYEKNPVELAKVCAVKFPPRDSTGAPIIDSSAKAQNRDYTKAIDSLNAEIKTLEEHLNGVLLAGTDDVELVQHPLRKEIQKLQKQLAELKAKGGKLQADYRPCESDTVYKTVTQFRENTAKVAVLEEEKKIVHAGLLRKTDEADRLKEGRDWWRKAAILLFIIIAGFFALKYFAGRLPFKV